MKNYFTKAEIMIWSSSVILIIISFAIFDRERYLTLAASLIGVTSLIFSAKGNPLGQLLMVVFSILYGIISFKFGYYGEMVTYLGMTMPMSVVALISWLRNPYNGNGMEVKVNAVGKNEAAFGRHFIRKFRFLLALFRLNITKNSRNTRVLREFYHFL